MKKEAQKEAAGEQIEDLQIKRAQLKSIRQTFPKKSGNLRLQKMHF